MNLVSIVMQCYFFFPIFFPPLILECLILENKWSQVLELDSLIDFTKERKEWSWSSLQVYI